MKSAGNFDLMVSEEKNIGRSSQASCDTEMNLTCRNDTKKHRLLKIFKLGKITAFWQWSVSGIKSISSYLLNAKPVVLYKYNQIKPINLIFLYVNV